MKTVDFLFVAFMCGSVAGGSARAAAPNTLTDEEREVGFKLLFNGRDLEGWRHGGNWIVDDGAIVCTRPVGHLVYQGTAIRDNLELRFEWKVVKQRNQPVDRPGETVPLDALFSVEVRMPQGEVDLEGRVIRGCGQVPIVYSTGGASIGLLSKEFPLDESGAAAIGLFYTKGPSKIASRALGRWNSGRIIWDKDRVEHWLNHEKVLETDMRLPESVPKQARRMLGTLRSLRSKVRPCGLHVVLEDPFMEQRGSRVLFRSIRLRMWQDKKQPSRGGSQEGVSR